MQYLKLLSLVLLFLLFFSCSADTSSKASIENTACRVYLDGDLAYCVSTDTTVVPDRDCKDRMYEIADGLKILVIFSGRPEDTASKSTYRVDTDCPNGAKIQCPGRFLGDSTTEYIYQSRYTGYCSSLQ